MAIRMSKEDRRVQICETARKLFLKEGFENVTMKDIINELEISVGGLYHYYSNIYDILNDVIVQSQEYKNNILFDIREKNPQMSLDEAMIETVVCLLFDRSEYSKLYIMFLIASKSNPHLQKSRIDIEKKSKNEYLKLLDQLDSEDYKCFINDDFTSFINTVKIGNYYLGYEKDTDEIKTIYRDFIKTYLMKNKEKRRKK